MRLVPDSAFETDRTVLSSITHTPKTAHVQAAKRVNACFGPLPLSERKQAAAGFENTVSELSREREGDGRKMYASAVAENPPASSRMRPRSQVMRETEQGKRVRKRRGREEEEVTKHSAED